MDNFPHTIWRLVKFMHLAASKYENATDLHEDLKMNDHHMWT